MTKVSLHEVRRLAPSANTLWAAIVLGSGLVACAEGEILDFPTDDAYEDAAIADEPVDAEPVGAELRLRYWRRRPTAGSGGVGGSSGTGGVGGSSGTGGVGGSSGSGGVGGSSGSGGVGGSSGSGGVGGSSAGTGGSSGGGALDSTGITLAVSASRTRGVAPLSVFFDTAGTTVNGTSNAFRDALFTWDFGDDAAARWVVSGRPKRTASGPVAHHVFEQPGTYTVSASVLDPTGRAATRRITITVDDPESVYAGTATVCVSTSGNFTGCPSGATRVSTSAFGEVAARFAASRRILLRRGEQWTLREATAIPHTAQGGTLGAFGSGAPPRIVYNSGPQGAGLVPRAPDFRVMDLELVSTDVHQRALVLLAADLLVLRVVVGAGFHYGFTSESQPRSAVVDTLVKPLAGGGGGYGAWVDAELFAMQGTVFEDARGVEHTLRAAFLRKSILSHNELGPAGGTKQLLKLNAPNGGAIHSEQIVVSDNVFRGGQGNVWPIVVGPQNDTSDNRVRDVLFERNHLRLGTTNGSVVGLRLSASRLAVRNNVFDMSTASGSHCVLVERDGIVPTPDDIVVSNNTCYSSKVQSLIGLTVRTATRVNAANNLIVGPGSLTAVSGTLTSSENLATGASVFMKDQPVLLDDFRLRAGAAPIDRGVSTFGFPEDITRGPRPVDGDGNGSALYDQGAFEYAR